MAKRRRARHKTCCRCEQPAGTLFRFQICALEGWVFACEACLLREKAAHGDSYRYGGTWKAGRT